MNPRIRCDGCLGSRSCWVCLGHGSIPTRFGSVATCRRCTGSGVCSMCRPEAAVVDLTAHDVPATAAS